MHLLLNIVVLVAMLISTGCKSPPRDRPAPAPVEQPSTPPSLPDPFALDHGGRADSPARWAVRWDQIKALLQREQYGAWPSARAALTSREVAQESLFDGDVVRRTVSLSIGPTTKIPLRLGLTLPSGEGPFPVIVHLDHRPKLFGCSIPREVAARGYALAELTPTDLCPDRHGVRGPAQSAFPDATWGTIACWAWGASRVVDYLQTVDAFHPRHLAVTGHSRSGKAALWAGALDQRFALTVPQGSGCGGAGSYKIRKPGSERLADMVKTFPHWFVPKLASYSGAEQRLPFDQHFVLAMVAPRAVLSIDALGDLWANPHGTAATHVGARPVFRFVSAPHTPGIALRPGKHELSDRDWRTLLDYADRVFGKPPQPGSAARPFDRLPASAAAVSLDWHAPPTPVSTAKPESPGSATNPKEPSQ